MPDPRLHPGYSLSREFVLEVFYGDGDNTETVKLAINSFNLPERSTRSFDVIWGPGFPTMTYPGPIAPFEFTVDVTNFYERGIVDFLIRWHEACVQHAVENFRDGYVIGRDDEGVIQYKANCSCMWPMRIGLGEMSRDTNRQHVNVTIFVFDIVHDFDLDRFITEEGCK
jgi:hypothetical protein